MKKNFVAVIPARGGSKGVKNKNIKLLDGYPLIYYCINVASKLKNIENFIVTTDSSKIINVSNNYCHLDQIIKRPKKLATDKSKDIDYLKHLIQVYQKKQQQVPYGWVILRPTTPLRNFKLVDKSIDYLRKNDDATSLISVHEISETPAKMFGISGKYLHGLAPFDPRKEYYTLPRQEFPPSYIGNGYVDIILTKSILNNEFYGDRMLPFHTPDTGEVDTENDFVNLEVKINNKNFAKYKIKK
jgi:CMP-N,N'-diacetyllegionaminic acid synthase